MLSSGPFTYSTGDPVNRDGLPWFAVHVRSKCEVVVSAALRAKGYEEFLPLYRARHHWSDREKSIELPLFPGYLFCRLDLGARFLPVLTTPGIVRIVGAGPTPIAVGENEIATIQAIIQSGLPALPCPFLTVGEPIVIERGPLAGLEGIVLHADKKLRLVVSVLLLQRSVAVEIERDWIRQLSPRKDAR